MKIQGENPLFSTSFNAWAFAATGIFLCCRECETKYACLSSDKYVIGTHGVAGTGPASVVRV